MKELLEKSLDPQLWHACAGSMVQIPPLNSKIFYFPQGHAEHCQSPVDFPFSSAPASKIPASILCRVAAVRFLADPETDEVYTKMSLVPLPPDEELDFDDEIGSGVQEKPASFAKTLTQSDANNGGGFSVPRYCAETIFPRLDYTADPPVQTVVAKDVHGEVWKFRHIYRGTPRRHLLTTGWSTFVNQKKLVAGDSIVFLRAENGDLCVGIRRAKRGIGGGSGPGWSSSSFPQSGWGINANTCGATGMANPYSNFSVFLKEDESKASRNGSCGGKGSAAATKVKAEEVLEAVRLAASGRPFDVYYYPRASTPEFCVKASSARAAMRIHWCPGMRFKMPFETEDSSRISWFMATVASVQVADPIRWPNSPWRLLQVTWDEPELLQNVKRVSPWLVEPVTNIPMIQPSAFSSPPRKKFRFPSGPFDFPLDGQLQLPSFSGNNNALSSSSSPFCYLSDNSAPAGIQGARHAHIGVSLSDLHHINHNKFHHHPPTGALFPPNLHQFNPPPPPPSLHCSRISESSNETVSCLLTIGNGNSSSSSSLEKPSSSSQEKKKQFFLFGQPILTEQQISHNHSSESISRSSCDEMQISSLEKPSTAGAWNQSCTSNAGGHNCKVFIESEDAGRSIDLTAFASYEELYTSLAHMFGMERAVILSHVLYRDTTGAVKRTGDEPFSVFSRTASRLTILVNPAGNDSASRTWMTRSAESGLEASNKRGPLSIFA
ncbi:unnamed protein product [Linum trigynum]|uniref:Auxin response factor n=1 Tax=Linum trigynum TaxID=586398 RepID=A0AAV2D5U1_9ROSI